jgi:hypothetical protein
LALFPIQAGFHQCAFGSDRQAAKQTDVWKAASSIGIDLPMDADPLVHLAYSDGRLFYLFYNVASVDDFGCPYLVQRIHKRVTDYAASDDAKSNDTFLVEEFKCLGGQCRPNLVSEAFFGY